MTQNTCKCLGDYLYADTNKDICQHLLFTLETKVNRFCIWLKINRKKSPTQHRRSSLQYPLLSLTSQMGRSSLRDGVLGGCSPAKNEILSILKDATEMNPETRAQRPSLRTHTWDTNRFPPRGGEPAKTRAWHTQPRAPMSARDLRGPGGARGGEAPRLSREVGKGKFESRAGMLLTGMARRPPPALPQGIGSKAAAA